MDQTFWLQRWQTNNIAFHKSDANPLLVKYFDTLALAKNSRVFLPLCGKTRDIAWLLAEGYRVAGAELVEMAVEQLFQELGVEPEISKIGAVRLYRAAAIDIFVGNIFDLSSQILGAVDAIYDRAALIALPEAMRDQYTAHLTAITTHAPQLLITCEYDQTLMDGPPFSISQAEVQQHYGDRYEVSLIASMDVDGGLKGIAATETVWQLQKLKKLNLKN
jgi:thiopurine S-methyltransferase